MTRVLLSATTAIALILSPLNIPALPMAGFIGVAIAASVDPALLSNFKAAKADVAAAEAALADAQSKGEGQEAAQQQLDAAKAAHSEAAKTVKKARAAAEAEAASAQAERPKQKAAETNAQDAIVKSGEETKAKEGRSKPGDANADLGNKKKKQPVAETAKQDGQMQTPPAKAENIEKAKGGSASEQPTAAKSANEAQPASGKANDGQSVAAETPVGAAATEAAAVPAPSADAPVANPIAEAPITEQIEKAAEAPAAVIPDRVTKEDEVKLRAAEQTRRAKAKQRRAELIGAAAVGVAVGVLIPVLGGRVVEDQGDRFVVERNGEYYVRKDEGSLLRQDGTKVRIDNLKGGRIREIVTRPNGVQIVTLRDPGGYVLRRLKVYPNGDEVVLYDSREAATDRFIDYDRSLPPIRIGIPQDQYIVAGGRANRRSLRSTFLAPPVENIRGAYSLREVRENNRLRSIVRRVDLDGITFDTGSATVRSSQVPLLGDTAGSMLDVIDEKPAAVFLVEGHTDAIGPEILNLTLSDRRAETVARILVEAYNIPPENLVVQGYGEAYLKINTQEAERQNRRVTIRNITPLLMTEVR